MKPKIIRITFTNAGRWKNFSSSTTISSYLAIQSCVKWGRAAELLQIVRCAVNNKGSRYCWGRWWWWWHGGSCCSCRTIEAEQITGDLDKRGGGGVTDKWIRSIGSCNSNSRPRLEGAGLERQIRNLITYPTNYAGLDWNAGCWFLAK